MHLLETLNLARTYVASSHLELLGKLNHLKALDLSHTTMGNDTLLAVKDALTGLEQLDVSYTRLVSVSSLQQSSLICNDCFPDLDCSATPSCSMASHVGQV